MRAGRGQAGTSHCRSVKSCIVQLLNGHIALDTGRCTQLFGLPAVLKVMHSFMYAGAITSRDPSAAQRDDAAYPPSKHARLHKDHTAPKSARVAARGGSAGRGGARGAGTRGKAKMLADESRFSRPHPLQVTPHTLHLPIFHVMGSRMCALNTNHGEQASASSAMLTCPRSSMKPSICMWYLCHITPVVNQGHLYRQNDLHVSV